MKTTEKENLLTTAIIAGFDEIVFTDDVTDRFRVIDCHGDRWKVQLDGKAYDAVLKSADIETKQFLINVSGYDFQVKLSEPIDKLMDRMGLLTQAKHIAKEVKSPMPGLIGTVYVSVGQSIVAGDKLLSLEAMKMENILKSANDGVIKKINAVTGQAVEKNAILIEFE
jgi:biotin carboxyl carrier protein